MMGSELRNVRSQSKEKPSRCSCPVMCVGAARDPLARRDRRAAIAPSSAGRPKASKPKANRTCIAAGAAEAGVGVADRVAAHVADVDVARGERRRGLYVAGAAARPGAAGVREASRSRQAACRAGLDRLRVIGSCEPCSSPSLMSDEDTQGDRTQGRRCYARNPLADVRDNTIQAPRRPPSDPALLAGSSRPRASARINRWR